MKTFLLLAATADGYIAQHHVQPTAWTSPEDKQHFRKLTTEAGVVVMGANTYKTLNRAFEERRTIVYTHYPEEITAEGVEVTQESPTALIKRLEAEGHTSLAIIGGAILNRQFLEAGVVDEVFLTIEPRLWGEGIGIVDQACDIPLELLEVSRLNRSTVLLHYRVQNA